MSKQYLAIVIDNYTIDVDIFTIQANTIEDVAKKFCEEHSTWKTIVDIIGMDKFVEQIKKEYNINGNLAYGLSKEKLLKIIDILGIANDYDLEDKVVNLLDEMSYEFEIYEVNGEIKRLNSKDIIEEGK